MASDEKITQRTKLDARKAGLSPAMRALLEKRLRGEAGNASQALAIPQRDRQRPPLLSFAQQRLWFLQQLVPESCAYNLPGAIHLQGELHLAVLAQSLNEIRRRHEVLRTTFRMEEGRAVQIIAPFHPLRFPVIDLRGLSAEEKERESQRLSNIDASRPFDLSKDEPFRIALLRLDAREHILMMNVHHIIWDAWSFEVFHKELTDLYRAFGTGQPSPLPDLPIQYADFARWQREWLQGTLQEQQLMYWKRQLEHAPALLNLPTDRPHPAVQTFRGASSTFLLPPAVAAGLKALGQREQATFFMVLLAAFNVLLYRYTGQEDILIGTPIAGRDRAETENLLGCFVNTLVLRTDLSQDPTFYDLLKRVRKVSIDAYTHQNVPFEKIIDELKVERDLSRNPLFQVMFVLLNIPARPIELPGLVSRVVETEAETAKFDLLFGCAEQTYGMEGVLEYNTDLFDESTILRMGNHLQTLLAGIVAHPEQRISRLPLLTADEQRQQVEWNVQASSVPPDGFIHHVIERQAERTPDTVAVIDEHCQLTYRELNRRANQLAHELRARGIGPESLVGICAERSPEMIIGLLGIIKAGAAYVPFDPTYPLERLNFLFQDAQLAVMLAQSHLLTRLPEQAHEVICLDTGWSAIAGRPTVNPGVRLTRENLVYVIYTSGSTGLPKGAMNTHVGVYNRLQWMQQTYRLDSTDRVLQKTPFSFDVSVWEFFWPLMTGACLVLARPEGHKDSAYLIETIRQYHVTTIHFVPSMLRAFLEEPDLETCESLRRVMCSGEALPLDLERQAFARMQAELHNLYGPTEAAIDVTFWQCVRNGAHQFVPIGRPIANTEIYILDALMQPVPVGVPGELYIGGAGLARGYLNHPEQTAEKFVPHPLARTPGARLYRTGDLARYHADGCIEYLGRLDFQVKVRGFRIEPGEIEAVLRQHPAVRDTIVTVREDAANHKRLVAYVVPQVNEGEAGGRDLAAEQVIQWQQVFDEAYKEVPAELDPTFNIIGWNSSYTGQPIRAEEMREWVEQTVERISALPSRSILEIGCGTGLLLFRLAPQCTHYCGTDISQQALDYIQHQIQTTRPDLSHVKLLHRAAEQFADLEAESFDCVVLNSVVQYFPGMSYLLHVLEKCIQVVRPGGCIFIGDVRDRTLLEVFHTSVECFHAPSSQPLALLRQRIEKRLSQENELVIDPAFFLALRKSWRQISRVEIQLKRGRFHNELTKFRYDVILHKETPMFSHPDPLCLDWQQAGLTLADLRHLLENRQPDLLRITNVPNARLSQDLATWQILRSNTPSATVGDLRDVLQTANWSADVDPEDFWGLRANLPYHLVLDWSAPHADGSYTAVFSRESAVMQWPEAGAAGIAEDAVDDSRSFSSYANFPLQEELTRSLVPALRSHVKEKLPEYMLPSAFVLLDALPLTSSGKVDRLALPPLPPNFFTGDRNVVAPRSPLEQTLADIWRQVLLLENISIHDNFFELGGDSIHSIQVVARARQAGLHFTPRDFFQHQTIAELAAMLELSLPGESTREYSSVVSPGPSDAPGVDSLIPLDIVSNAPLVELSQGEIEQIRSVSQEVEDIYPLTPQQEHMLLHFLALPATSVFSWQNVSILEADLNYARFEEAWQTVVDRYSLLRTSFWWEGLRRPVQLVQRRGNIQIEREDWRAVSPEKRGERLKAYRRASLARGFDRTQPTPLRLSLIQVEQSTYYFILTGDYMRTEGWSIGLLTDEVSRLYQALCTGGTSPAPPSLPYKHYLRWQQTQDLTRAQAFWQQKLKGLELPTPLIASTSSRAPEQEDSYEEQSCSLSPSVTARLQSFAKQHKLTINTIAQAAWALLLHCYTQREDVAFGVFLTGRSASIAGIETVIGHCITILPMRVHIPSDAPLLAWLQTLQNEQIELNEYEYTPPRNIRRWCGLPDSLPLFESYLVFQNLSSIVTFAAPQQPLTQETEDFLIPSRSVGIVGLMEHPLRVDVLPGRRLTILMTYYHRYFSDAAITRIIQSLQILLEGMIAEPEQSLATLLHLVDATTQAQ